MKYSIMLLVVTLLVSGCASVGKQTILSEPPGAKIFVGSTKENLIDIGQRTPYAEQQTLVGEAWQPQFFQVKKAGYRDSAIVFKEQVVGDRNVFLILTPLPPVFEMQSAITEQQLKCTMLAVFSAMPLYQTNNLETSDGILAFIGMRMMLKPTQQFLKEQLLEFLLSTLSENTGSRIETLSESSC